MNSLVISGHLGADPRLNRTQSGESVLNLRVAVNQRVKRDGQWVDEPIWFTVTVFGSRADGLGKILKKGRMIEAAGELRIRQYQAHDGTQRTDIECYAYRCDPLGSGTDRQAQPATSNQSDRAPRREQQAHGEDPAHGYAAPAGTFPDDDDIPF